MVNIIIKKSTNKNKKFMIIITSDNRKKTLYIGSQGMSDYTIHKNDERKQRYIQRHKKRENWNDIYSRGFYSRWILWNKKTIKSSIADTNKRFNLHIRFEG